METPTHAAEPAAQATRPASATCDFCGTDAYVVPVLEARDYEYGIPGTWALHRCRRCGFYYQVPRPAPEAIPAFYPPSYAVYGDDPVLGWVFRGLFWLEARRVRDLIGGPGRVLDVGCGGGGFLSALERLGPFEVYGLELDAGAAAYAQSQGLRVQQRDLLEADLEPGSFDLVRMGHVIEHVTDPLATLRRALEVLRPGGVLYGETPNVDCWDFRLFGRYWGALHFPRHITLFSERTLRRALEATGFSAVEISPRLRTVGWSAGVQNLLADCAHLRVPSNGRVPWYPLLIVPFLPFTAVQSLFSRPASLAFVARRPCPA